MERRRIDFHVHTRASSDGVDRPEVVVAAARAKGLDGVCITDHDVAGGYRRLVRLGLADPSGRPVDGFLVIPGVEVSTAAGHVLVIGWAFDAPRGLSVRQVCAMARARGAIAAPAHPFDPFRSGVGQAAMDDAEPEAVEVFNSKSLSRGSNTRAKAWAVRHGAAAVAGSDAHFAAAVGRAHAVVETAEFSTAGVLDAVRARRVEVVEGLHTRLEVARYIALGWFTRPWLFERLARMSRRPAAELAGQIG